MPTKLKTPITITITNPANAVCAFLEANCNEPSVLSGIHQNLLACRAAVDNGSIRGQLLVQLNENGIDPFTWLPPQPFKIAGRECTFNADGTVALSGGTTITNDKIADFLKRRDEMMRSEWPMYWRNTFNLPTVVYRAKDANDKGSYFSGCHWHSTDGLTMVERAAKYDIYKPITRAEAIAIVGAENIDK